MRGSHITSLLLCLFGLSSTALAACSNGAFDEAISGTQMAQANELYKEGSFAEAASRYQELVDAGAKDGRLYYNLGNAYLKLGDVGRAVLNFRRAQRLLPRDGDVDANLKLARAHTLDRIQIENEGAIVILIRQVIGWSSIDESATAVLILWIVLVGLGIIAILWRQRQRTLIFVAAGVALLLIIGLLSIGSRLLDEHGQPPAVVVADELTVRSGPGDDYLAEFVLHSGTEVRVVDRRADWIRVVLPGDLHGWAPGEAVIQVSARD